MSQVSPHDALIHVMVMMSAADRSMTDLELRKIGNIIETLPAFGDYDSDDLMSAVNSCSEILQEDDGMSQIVSNVRDNLPENLHETAYALAVEVAAADLSLKQEELRLLQILRDHLDLDRLACAAIERGARARHQAL